MTDHLRAKKLRIGILGTRGIPNQYGGFEQFAEYLSAGLVKRGHEVFVYNVHHHNYQMSTWNGVHIIHKYDPEPAVGTAGQFLYDLNCIIDSRKRSFDILLQLGYTSSSVWSFLLPSRPALTLTNMDGLEWKRTKYSPKVQKFLKWAERTAVKNSDALIADSLGIQQYLEEAYYAKSAYIPYGAHLFDTPDPVVLNEYDVMPFRYYMLVARMEPENNIEMILDGATAAGNNVPFLVIGNIGNSFGKYLVHKYAAHQHIRFCGGIYNLEVLNNLRWHSRIYFHGHSVGGTNPSLLEAMACKTLIAAHKNLFNSAILGKEALYFSSAEEVKNIIIKTDDISQLQDYREANYQKIRDFYNWERIINDYETFFTETMNKMINRQ